MKSSVVKMFMFIAMEKGLYFKFMYRYAFNLSKNQYCEKAKF